MARLISIGGIEALLSPPEPGRRLRPQNRLLFPDFELVLMTALLWGGLSGLWLGLPPVQALAGTSLLVGLVLISRVDMARYWLPDALTLPLGCLGLVWGTLTGAIPLMDQMIGAVVGFAVLAGIAALFQRVRGYAGLGGGDARLLAALGVWIGWRGLAYALLIAAVSALFFAGTQSLIQRTRLDLKDRLPFGPFLALGGFSVWVAARLVQGWP
ncbi:MAG: prepilin peptidase [Asticcacaulis sp.]